MRLIVAVGEELDGYTDFTTNSAFLLFSFLLKHNFSNPLPDHEDVYQTAPRARLTSEY